MAKSPSQPDQEPTAGSDSEAAATADPSATDQTAANSEASSGRDRNSDSAAGGGSARGGSDSSRGGSDSSRGGPGKSRGGPGESGGGATGGRGTARLALLLALIALGVAGYLYYEQWQRAQQPPAWEQALATLQAQSEQQLDEARASREALQRETQDRLADMSDRQRDRLSSELDALETRIEESMAAQIGAQPPGQRAWRLAEAEYLLRLANQRLHLADDARGAMRLLAAADLMLAALDDPAYVPVRERIGEERHALEALLAVDRTGLFLELEELKRDIQRLPLAIPDYRAPAADAAEIEELGLWSRIWQRLRGLFEFRRLEGEGLQPLLGPEQAEWLALHLQLILERAQNALLRDETEIYQASLETAAHYLETYLAKEQPRVADARSTLTRLAETELDPERPDIGGSLLRLQRLIAAEDLFDTRLIAPPPGVVPEPEVATEPDVDAVEAEAEAEANADAEANGEAEPGAEADPDAAPETDADAGEEDEAVDPDVDPDTSAADEESAA